MNKSHLVWVILAALMITACQSTSEPQVVAEPFFPTPPQQLMTLPPELEPIEGKQPQ